MLILTGSEVDGKIEGLCSICYRDVGEFDLSELAELAKSNTPIICFECDPGAADSVHPALYCEDGRYLLKIQDDWFSVNIWEEVKAKTKLLRERDNRIAKIYDDMIRIFGG